MGHTSITFDTDIEPMDQIVIPSSSSASAILAESPIQPASTPAKRRRAESDISVEDTQNLNQAEALEQATLESIQYKTASKKYKMLLRREQDKTARLQKEYDAERYEHLEFAKQMTVALESRAKEVQKLKKDVQDERARTAHAEAAIAMVTQVGFILTCPLIFANHPDWIRTRMERAAGDLELLHEEEHNRD
ncbi:hypothetical protein EV368DRAFT_88206 [Lentinula lateritia]|nr:hypothetical protein EV368DRAFT_88206 [Lentinula lateritia]